MSEKIGNLADILEVAVRIERNGIDLYKRLHELAADSNARDVFNFLAADEEKHAGSFRKMLEEVADYNPRFVYPGEYEEYLQGVACRAIEGFKKGDAMAGKSDAAEAVEIAMDLEVGSVAFYTELLDGFDSPEAKQRIQQIINEEKSHLAKLKTLKDNFRF